MNTNMEINQAQLVSLINAHTAIGGVVLDIYGGRGDYYHQVSRAVMDTAGHRPLVRLIKPNNELGTTIPDYDTIVIEEDGAVIRYGPASWSDIGYCGELRFLQPVSLRQPCGYGPKLTTIWLVVERIEDGWDHNSVGCSTVAAYWAKSQAEAEAKRLEADAAWASNQPDWDGDVRTYYVVSTEVKGSAATPEEDDDMDASVIRGLRKTVIRYRKERDEALAELAALKGSAATPEPEDGFAPKLRLIGDKLWVETLKGSHEFYLPDCREHELRAWLTEHLEDLAEDVARHLCTVRPWRKG